MHSALLTSTRSRAVSQRIARRQLVLEEQLRGPAPPLAPDFITLSREARRGARRVAAGRVRHPTAAREGYHQPVRLCLVGGCRWVVKSSMFHVSASVRGLSC